MNITHGNFNKAMVEPHTEKILLSQIKCYQLMVVEALMRNWTIDYTERFAYTIHL